MSDTYTARARTTIDASTEAVWNALTDPGTIEQWFFDSTVETEWEVGSPIYFRGEWEGETYEDKGEIQRFEREDVLEYTHWSPLSGKPDVPENYQTVTWELAEVGGGTEVTLTQDNNDSEEARDHSEENWELVLGNLKELLESKFRGPMDPIFFDSRGSFRDWLEAHLETEDELWVGYYKVDAERSGIGYAESVEEALCFGWIDGLIHGIDDQTYKRRFTPRKPDSKWSKANTERVEAMVEAGKMTPAGMELVEAAKASGEWDEAYRLADDHDIPDELEAALKEDETAWENFQAFSNSDQHAFIALVEEAKTEGTKAKRIERTVELAEKDLRAYDEENKRRL